MLGQLGLDRAIVRSALGQFFQRPCQRCRFGDDPRFAGAVRGQRERLGERGDGLVDAALLGVCFRQRDAQIGKFALFEIHEKQRPNKGVGPTHHGEPKAAQGAPPYRVADACQLNKQH